MSRKQIRAHPNNVRKLREMIDNEVTGNKDIHSIYGYYVVEDRYLPETHMFKTGKIIWKDTKFITYSSGPSPESDMTYKEYLQMCLRLGWAEEETKEEMVFYEIDGETLSQFMGHMKWIRHARKIAKKIEEDTWAKLSADSRYGLSSLYNNNFNTVKYHV